jgi:sec-independent protein translocase protein TatA
MFGISPVQLLIILVIVVLIFGTKKLRNMGGDVGGAVKNFKSAMKEGDDEAKNQQSAKSVDSVEKDDSVIEGEAKKVNEKEDV